jgi:hypothetical protein
MLLFPSSLILKSPWRSAIEEGPRLSMFSFPLILNAMPPGSVYPYSMKCAYLLLACFGAFASDHVVLRTGFQLQAQRHEVRGENIVLHTATGVIELPLSQVEYIETAEAEPPPPPAPPTPKPPQPALNPKQLVDKAAERWGLPAELLHSVARAESSYRPDAISPKGAIGIMQLMPATAAELQADPRDPAQNVDAGARRLRQLLLQYDGQTGKALAAYNAGAGAVERHNGIPPYPETRLYVQKVLWNYHRLSQGTREP